MNNRRPTVSAKVRQMSESKSSTICVVVERPDHHYGVDYVPNIITNFAIDVEPFKQEAHHQVGLGKTRAA